MKFNEHFQKVQDNIILIRISVTFDVQNIHLSPSYNFSADMLLGNKATIIIVM